MPLVLFTALLSATPADHRLGLELYGDWIQLEHCGHRSRRNAGIVPARMRLANLSDAERRLHLRLDCPSDWLHAEISTAVTLFPWGRVDLTLPIIAQPRMYRAGDFRELAHLTVREGNRQLFTEEFLLTSSGAKLTGTPPMMLVAAEIPGGSSLQTVYLDLSIVGSGQASARELWLVPPESIPPHLWYAYVNVPMVMVHGPALAQLTAAQREALWKYAAWGGSVYLVAASPADLLPPTMASALIRKAQPHEGDVVYPFLLGSLIEIREHDGSPIDLAAFLRSARQEPGDTVRKGHTCFFSALLKRCLPQHGTRRSWAYRRPEQHTTSLTAEFNKPPTTTYVLVLILFVLVAGPVNYLVLWRLKRPILLLVTAPAVSVTFIVFLLAATFLAHGVGLKQTLATFTFLDQVLGLQATTARYALFSALPPSALRIPHNQLILPLGEGLQTSNRLAEDQALGGLLPAITPESYLGAEVAPTRKRLAVRTEGGHITVVNGLGVRINRLLLSRRDTVYEASDIAAGAQAELTETRYPHDQMTAAPNLSNVILGPRKRRFDSVSPTWAYTMPDRGDCFAAIVATSPFWTGLPGARITQQHHVVYGTYSHAP